MSPTAEHKLEEVMSLLHRAAEYMESQAPDEMWWREYFLLTGEHMILTDEGWESASVKESYEREAAEHGESWKPLDEVNAPDSQVKFCAECTTNDHGPNECEEQSAACSLAEIGRM